MTEGFSAEWLTLREPYDAAARDPGLLRRLAEWSAGRDRLRVVDLGAGTGANPRRLAPLLGGGQDWTLAERDPALIARGDEASTGVVVRRRYRRLDLARDLGLLERQGCELITASALLDLVSAEWLDALVGWRRRSGAALYVALSYTGEHAWQPAEDLDRTVLALVNAHQGTDKGFGPALGPAAVEALAAKLSADAGARELAASDWLLGPGDRAIQLALLGGYVAAAQAMAPEHAADLAAWAERRRRLVQSGRSRHEVGHRDLLFLPEGRSGCQ